MIQQPKRVLGIFAHYDDEVLICGGTLLKWAEGGSENRILFFTAPDTGRTTGFKLFWHNLFSPRRQAAGRAAEALQYHIIDKHPRHIEKTLSALPEEAMTRRIRSELQCFRPDVLITHAGSDTHQDHRALFKAVIIACRPLCAETPRLILSGEDISGAQQNHGKFVPRFIPQVYIDITPQFDRKMEALQIYGSELRRFPHPRSIEGICAYATMRGTTIAVSKSEAFELVYLRG